MWLTEKPKIHVFWGTLGWWSFFILIFWEMASGFLQVRTLTDTNGLFLTLSALDKNRMLSLVTDICPVCRNAQGRCSILGLHCIKMSYSHLLTDYGTIHPQTPWNLSATGILVQLASSASELLVLIVLFPEIVIFYLSPVIPLYLENTTPLWTPPASLVAPLV